MDNRNSRGGVPPRRTPPTAAGQTGRPAQRPANRTAQSAGTQNTPNGTQRQQKKPRRSENRWFRAIIMVLITVGMCMFLAIYILQNANDLLGLNQEDKQIEVSIPEGSTVQQIASILSKAGVVEQSVTFQLYASIKTEEGDLLPGNYLFNSNMGYDQIFTLMKMGNIIRDVVTIPFIEGWTVYDYAKTLEENKVCDADEFLEFIQNGELSYEFMDQMPESGLRFRRLEGYLFPDTYDFYVGEKVDSVARKFLRNFNDKITRNMYDKMLDLNMTLDEVIALASVIQKEAGGVNGIDEMERVSSVFRNRLDQPELYPKLQSDVTKHYVNNYITPFQRLKDQDMYDAYNTYVCDGLPVGPICNPGLDAIMAALSPAETPYCFFVTDVNEHFYYSITAQEHYQNVRSAAAVEGEGEIHGIDTE